MVPDHFTELPETPISMLLSFVLPLDIIIPCREHKPAKSNKWLIYQENFNLIFSVHPFGVFLARKIQFNVKI